jgi:hypothetical protein
MTDAERRKVEWVAEKVMGWALSADGIEAYREFFGGLKTSDKKHLRDTIHEECKLDAEQATAAEEPQGEDL